MDDQRLIHSYGRRRGRKLRATRAALVDETLPALTIAAPAGALLDPFSLFARRPEAVWLEVGFGGGEHLAAQAGAHREIGLIGAEPYVNGVAGLLAQLAAGKIDNVRLWPGDVRLLLPHFPSRSVDRAFVLFPDPWPKQRHHKRRLVAPAFLDALARVLKPGAELRLATDDPDYLAWMLDAVLRHPAFAWTARRPDDWRIRPADAPPTRYEAKAIAAGRRPAYLRFARRLENP